MFTDGGFYTNIESLASNFPEEDAVGLEFILHPDGTKALFGKELEKDRKSLPIIEYKSEAAAILKEQIGRASGRERV